MDEPIYTYEVEYKGKVYVLNIKSENEPSEEAIKNCNKIVNSIMNKLYNEKNNVK